MKKILVTTDFSSKSKSGLLFAIQLASQTKFELTFLHVYNILVPTAWHVKKGEEYEKAETKIIQDKLNMFVDKIYKDLGKINTTKNYIIQSSIFPQNKIMEYAEQEKFDFICMSTKGAGNFEHFFGTNTSNTINNSHIPVIAVPHNYKPTAITSILYASDLVNLEKELKNVVDFSKPLKSKIELLHFTTPLETIMDHNVLEVAVKKLLKYDIKMNIKNSDLADTMIANIEMAIKNIKPSMLIMFTEQNRTLFQKIFLSSISADYSFNPKIPLLVFNKSAK